MIVHDRLLSTNLILKARIKSFLPQLRHSRQKSFIIVFSLAHRHLSLIIVNSRALLPEVEPQKSPKFWPKSPATTIFHWR
jgi:hypothetical protein